MRSLKLTITTFFSIVFAGAFCLALGQTPEKPSVVTGDVVSVAADKIVLNTKDGSLHIVLTEKTLYKRVPPENPSLQAAVAAAFTDIGEGDKLVITGFFSADKKSLPARTVYLMTKADIAQRNSKESEDWKTRGITGRVTSVDPVAKKINVETRTLMGSSTIALTPKDNAKFLRYAPDSVKFSEAKASSLVEVQTGDMIRALGDKSTDGGSFAAEEVVTGAFQTVAGTVKAIDTTKNEVVIADLRTKKDITIAIGPTSILKRFPQEMAARLAGFQGGGGVRPVGQGATPPTNTTGQGQGQTPGAPGRGGFGGRGGGGIDEMLDRFPNITAADLKVGDMIAVSSTKTGSLDRITAIKLLAGVEPFLRAAQASGRPNGNGGIDNFNIPGLDGFGGP